MSLRVKDRPSLNGASPPDSNDMLPVPSVTGCTPQRLLTSIIAGAFFGQPPTRAMRLNVALLGAPKVAAPAAIKRVRNSGNWQYVARMAYLAPSPTPSWGAFL